MNKYLLAVPVLAIGIGVGTLVNSQVSAHGFGEGHDQMISRLAQAFGKTEEEVEDVFDQMREERQADRQVEVELKLDEAIAAGTITLDQKQLILDKMSQLREEHESLRDTFKDLSPEERRAQMASHRGELQQWAEDNGINLPVLELGPRGGQGRPGGRGMRFQAAQ